MSKEDFLEGLTQALLGEVPQRIIQENVRYYDSYISDEVRKGNAIDEVLATLGDPRLIAKTIIDTMEAAGTASDSAQYHETNSGGYDQNVTRNENTYRLLDTSKWYWKPLMLILVLVIVVVIFTVVGGILSLVVPLVGPILMILFIMWFIKGFRR